jgi:hypothetical protein
MEVSVAGCIVLFKHFLVISNKTTTSSATILNFELRLFLFIYFCLFIYSMTDLGRYISVAIATRYGLDGQGIESRWGRDFSHPSRPALGTTHPPMEWVPSLSRG